VFFVALEMLNGRLQTLFQQQKKEQCVIIMQL